MKKVKLNYKPKPFIVPDGMVVIQDTREQIPLFTRIPKGLTIQSAKLDNGDYSIKGHEQTFCVERKMIGDLVTYCTSEKSKTLAKMERFKKMEWVGLVIEARESDVARPYNWSKVSPEAVRQAIVSFSVRYGVHVYINPNHDNVVRFVLDHMIKYYRIKREL